MSNWDRITLMKLSDVIRGHLAQGPASALERRLLEPLLTHCDRASHSVTATPELVREVVNQMREICNNHSAHPCACVEVSGISPACYFSHNGDAA